MNSPRELLEKWLMSKNYHALDIQKALTWYDAQIKAGAKPTDDDVLHHAHVSYKSFVRDDMTKENSGAFVIGICGGACAILVKEVLLWLLTVLR